MIRHDLLSISTYANKIFSNIAYTDFYTHTEELLQIAINDEQISPCKVHATRFLIWLSRDKDKKYREELPLIFPSAFSQKQKKHQAAIFLAYIMLSQKIVEQLGCIYNDNYYSGIVRNVAEKTIPSIFYCKNDTFYNRRLEKSNLQYFPSICDLKDTKFETNKMIYTKLVRKIRAQIKDPIYCELEKKNIKLDAAAEELIDYVMSNNKFSKYKKNVEKKYSNWQGILPQMLLVEMWLQTVLESSNNMCSEFWVFPSPSNLTHDYKVDYYGAIWMFPEKHKRDDFYKWYMITKEIFLRGFWSEKVKDTIKHGSKAAMSAIMSRNMSHNIGSHVLSYWGNKLRSKIENEEATDINDLELSKNLFDYLKQRMDFIAEITTTVPAWEEALDLNKFVVDNFSKQFVLLDNIARSEGFCYYMNCHKMHSFKPENNCNTCNRYLANSGEEPVPMKIIYSGEDFYVSIPHGMVGIQAFYSILENFIRNSAKHGGSRIRQLIRSENSNKPKALEFTIYAEEDFNYSDYVKITISDNIGNCCDFINKENRLRVIDILNDAIKDNEYIKAEDGRIKKGSWGIKEMKVSANFLRRKEVDILVSGDISDKEPVLLNIDCYSKCQNSKQCNKTDKNVSVTFFLRKPKEACVVTINEDIIASNSKCGVDVYSYKEFKNILQNETIPHRFLVFNKFSDEISSLIESHRERLPCRIIIQGTNNSVNPEKTNWLNPTYIASINFEEIKNNPEIYLYELYKNFVSDKIGNTYEILMRHINDGWEERGICIATEEINDRINLRRMIIFDKHFGMIEEDTHNNVTKIPESIYYQGISGSTSFGKTLENNPKENRKKFFLKELVEAALVKVLIADERIWKNSQSKINISVKQNKTVSVERIELLKKMGIYLVPIDGNIVSEQEKNNVLNNDNEVVFFIIHKGLVEKMNDIENGTGTTFVQNTVNKFPFVLIDSGRGEQEQLEDGTRYIPMSAIERFIEDMDKYSLVQTLFSVRRSERGK